jgi:hypothetical protein
MKSFRYSKYPFGNSFGKNLSFIYFILFHNLIIIYYQKNNNLNYTPFIKCFVKLTKINNKFKFMNIIYIYLYIFITYYN